LKTISEIVWKIWKVYKVLPQVVLFIFSTIAYPLSVIVRMSVLFVG